MTTVAEMARRWRTVTLRTQVPIIIQSQSDELAELNKMQLFQKSLLATGQRLELYGDIKYALDKEKLNPQPGFLHPDLKLTGDFYDGWLVTVKAPYINFTSDDAKTDQLVLNYTQYIFGLTKENKTIYATGSFYTALKAYITAQTGYRFG